MRIDEFEFQDRNGNEIEPTKKLEKMHKKCWQALKFDVS